MEDIRPKYLTGHCKSNYPKLILLHELQKDKNRKNKQWNNELDC